MIKNSNLLYPLFVNRYQFIDDKVIWECSDLVICDGVI